MTRNTAIERAVQAIRAADALLIAAGAGMGVDSGLPDFRGPQGFWRAYPPYQKLGLHFVDLANPRWFRDDPELAWGFYGHRFQLYRATQPHDGFSILQRWATGLKYGAFVFTSNVDGHFQRAGFDEARIIECHGSVHWLQCTARCGQELWPVPASVAALIDLDEETMRARPPLPGCPSCGALARPNVLMFGDWQWDSARTAAQEARVEAWLQDIETMRLAIIECGAGTGVPTVRHFCERMAVAAAATLIRINLRESQVPEGQISISLGALEALKAIDRALATTQVAPHVNSGS
jgi:NAD-dependent SIR2 family protein deacetylase